jgi:hypothetical protein
MNPIVTSWQRHENRVKYDGPDSVTIDDETITLKESHMPVQTELPDHQLNNVLRFVKMAALNKVLGLKTATFNTLKRLGVKRDGRMAARKVPKGSDQGDVGSIIRWMDGIQPTDKKAVAQIVKIDATCCRRVGG